MELRTLCHGKIEKVIESHECLKAQKSTNRVKSEETCFS